MATAKPWPCAHLANRAPCRAAAATSYPSGRLDWPRRVAEDRGRRMDRPQPPTYHDEAPRSWPRLRLAMTSQVPALGQLAAALAARGRERRAHRLRLAARRAPRAGASAPSPQTPSSGWYLPPPSPSPPFLTSLPLPLSLTHPPRAAPTPGAGAVRAARRGRERRPRLDCQEPLARAARRGVVRGVRHAAAHATCRGGSNSPGTGRSAALRPPPSLLLLRPSRPPRWCPDGVGTGTRRCCWCARRSMRSTRTGTWSSPTGAYAPPPSPHKIALPPYHPPTSASHPSSHHSSIVPPRLSPPLLSSLTPSLRTGTGT